MLSAAALTVADRLIATLMTLVDAVGAIARDGTSKTLSSHAAENLFIRLVGLVTTLIRLSTDGLRPPSEREPAENPREPIPLDERRDHASAERLPRRPGWLLAALPDLAPAIAADLRVLLADPALAALLAAAPSLQRALRPILRGLGLNRAAPPNPDPPIQPATRSPASPGESRSVAPSSSPPPPRRAPAKLLRPAFHTHTANSLRYRNKTIARLKSALQIPNACRKRPLND